MDGKRIGLNSRRVLVAIVTLALLITSLFALPIITQDKNAEAYAAVDYTGAWEGNKAPTPLLDDEDPTGIEPLSGEANAKKWLPKSYAWPYPWSRNEEATGNWIADSYGLSASDASLFEAITVDRLADVLSVEGARYYVVFATPRSKAGQKLIKAANVAAKAANAAAAGSVKKIYVFNPVIDDYQVDITLTSDIGNWAGSIGHDVKGTWTYLKGLLANGGILKGDGGAKGDNVFDFTAYTPQTAVLFSTTQNTKKAAGTASLNTLRTISAAASADAATAVSYTNTAAADATLIDDITSVFKDDTSNYVADSAVRTDFDFARRFWNAGINDFNYNSGNPSDARLGRNDLNFFPTAAEYANLPAIDKANLGTYTAENFPLEFVDFVEGFNLLNTSLNQKNWLNYFFATIGCHNSQAYISEFAKKGVKYNQKVYINDDTLDGSFRFGTTVDTKDAKNTAANQGSTANTWLSARNSGYKFSYLYGHTIEYLGDKVISKNETYKNNSIQYYYNGDESNASAQTAPRTGFGSFDATTLAARPAGNAVRLQIPFAYSFNGGTELSEADYAPVVPDTQFLHRKVTDDGRYSEYMMETTSVWGSPESVAATSSQTTDEVDGYPTGTGATPGGASAYAQEGRDYPLESVFLHQRLPEPTDLYFNAPTPLIEGTVKVGETVSLNAGDWPVSRFTYSSGNIDFITGTTPNVTKVGDDAEVAVGGATLTATLSNANSKVVPVALQTIPVSITLNAGTYPIGDIDSSKFEVTGVDGYDLTATAAVTGTNVRIRVVLTKKADTNLTVEWKVNDNIVKAGVLDADNSAYGIDAADLGKKLSVSVTGTHAVTNFIYDFATTKTSAVRTVIEDTIIRSEDKEIKGAVPTISGKAKVGQKLTAKAGTWSPADVTLAYQWYAGTAPINGATSSTLVLTKSQLGKKITVKVTGSKTDYVTASKVSAATAKVTSDFIKAPVPKIKGTAKVGKKLSVNVGTWSPKPKFTYQWYANGKAIKGATKATLKLKNAQKGKKITVKVTASKTNYTKTIKTSKATKKVKK